MNEFHIGFMIGAGIGVGYHAVAYIFGTIQTYLFMRAGRDE